MLFFKKLKLGMTGCIWILVLSSASSRVNEQRKPWDGAGEAQGSPGYPEKCPEKALQMKLVSRFFNHLT